MTRLKLATADTFRSMRHRNFRIFYFTQGISFIGTWLQFAAQTILVYRLTDSGIALGLLTAFQFAPSLVFGAYAGVVIDRYDKRRLMTVTGSVMLLAAAVLALLVSTGLVTPIAVYGLAALLGLANAFDSPARRTLVNDLVPEKDVVNAVALNSTLITAARIVGPAAAGALIATVGIGWCFALNAVSFAPVLAGLRMMDPSTFRSVPVPRARGQLRAGLRYAMSVEDIRVPLLLMAVVGTLSFNFAVLLPLLAERDLGGSVVTYTILTSCFGVGSLFGSVRMARRATIDTAALAKSAVVFGIASAALAFSPSLLLACLALLPSGFASVGVLSGGNAVLQVVTSAEMRGRVLALYSVAFLGSTPIGGPIAGWTAQRYGTAAGILLGAAASLGSGLTVLAVARRRAGLVVDAESLESQPVLAGAG